MKLLIITQRVDINDDNLGFFHGWIEGLAQRTEKLYVVCLSEGEHRFPENVEVYSMGKEGGANKAVQFFRLQKYLIRNLNKADGIFVHMAPIYAILSFPIATLLRKKILMWYTHKSQNWKLWFAEKLVGRIYTASVESFRIGSKKVKATGHGIDIQLFKPDKLSNGVFRILTAGRIEPSKDLETQICALDILVNQEGIKNIEMTILGSGQLDYYEKKIRALIYEKKLGDYVRFLGSIPNRKMPAYYNKSDLFINSGRTGGVDKAVLEAMACATPVIVSNEAFYPMFSKSNQSLLFKEGDYRGLSEGIKHILLMDEGKRLELGTYLRSIVKENHNLDNLIEKIVSYFRI